MIGLCVHSLSISPTSLHLLQTNSAVLRSLGDRDWNIFSNISTGNDLVRSPIRLLVSWQRLWLMDYLLGCFL